MRFIKSYVSTAALSEAVNPILGDEQIVVLHLPLSHILKYIHTYTLLVALSVYSAIFYDELLLLHTKLTHTSICSQAGPPYTHFHALTPIYSLICIAKHSIMLSFISHTSKKLSLSL